jgi:hypothetical protein
LLTLPVWLISFSAVLAQQKDAKEKPKEAQAAEPALAPVPADAASKVNPVKSTPIPAA